MSYKNDIAFGLSLNGYAMLLDKVSKIKDPVLKKKMDSFMLEAEVKRSKEDTEHVILVWMNCENFRYEEGHNHEYRFINDFHHDLLHEGEHFDYVRIGEEIGDVQMDTSLYIVGLEHHFYICDDFYEGKFE